MFNSSFPKFVLFIGNMKKKYIL